MSRHSPPKNQTPTLSTGIKARETDVPARENKWAINRGVATAVSAVSMIRGPQSSGAPKCARINREILRAHQKGHPRNFDTEPTQD
ncbi:hypothetical protein TNCV_3507231 [Trichonephila clavipes]|uniref:Uncharacterized protein n=1 Tax=Trichonephila clavipes TaxID=2585209 RepID=A0A8X6VCH0_TRICX|nr:hypothetical protein TNCV_3507231 [Trichonephila clavipes]